MDLTKLPEVLSLGAMAAVLLYHTLKKSQESDRALAAIACTIVALQKSIILLESGPWRQTVETAEHDDCKKCAAALARLEAILEEQSKTLERIYSVKS